MKKIKVYLPKRDNSNIAFHGSGSNRTSYKLYDWLPFYSKISLFKPDYTIDSLLNHEIK
ncbi:hypothetical protein ADICYQ_2908 [Cyclobacterium qasimii M12-11B]|uniref:Uncharacterized protein n=1 Tax=Cyclobacterium qasimii M12-11B TaxID=641524 RepID=S7WVX1_9BACT|nr:hypothetical protein ADICYQ_2908 [Cyclobacterium qasimii M12-11B]